MIEAVENKLGQLPQRVLADSGYRSEQVFVALEQMGVEALVALGREGKNRTAIDRERYPASARMAERLASAEGQGHYRRRKVIPEPVFGWIKHIIGFRQFSFRGLTKVSGEWNLVCVLRSMCVACGCSKEYEQVTSGLRFHRSGLAILRAVAHASPIWATAATQDASQTHGLLNVDLLRTHVLLRRLLATFRHLEAHP